MESDTVPIRNLWLDRLYEEVKYSSDFWMKGSIYRGKSSWNNYCYALCGCAEHINANSLYKLQDPAFNEFLSRVKSKVDYSSYSCDAFIMHYLKQPENFPFFQQYAHKFVYTDIIQHAQQTFSVKEVRKQFPDTYLLHQPIW